MLKLQLVVNFGTRKTSANDGKTNRKQIFLWNNKQNHTSPCLPKNTQIHKETTHTYTHTHSHTHTHKYIHTHTHTHTHTHSDIEHSHSLIPHYDISLLKPQTIPKLQTQM